MPQFLVEIEIRKSQEPSYPDPEVSEGQASSMGSSFGAGCPF